MEFISSKQLEGFLNKMLLLMHMSLLYSGCEKENVAQYFAHEQCWNVFLLCTLKLPFWFEAKISSGKLVLLARV